MLVKKKKVYRVEVHPEPYVFCIEAISKNEAREQMERLYNKEFFRIVVSSIKQRILFKTKGILNKARVNEILGIEE
jgi:hypothetical protein